jgi:hypothetical protein
VRQKVHSSLLPYDPRGSGRKKRDHLDRTVPLIIVGLVIAKDSARILSPFLSVVLLINTLKVAAVHANESSYRVELSAKWQKAMRIPICFITSDSKWHSLIRVYDCPFRTDQCAPANRFRGFTYSFWCIGRTRRPDRLHVVSRSGGADSSPPSDHPENRSFRRRSFRRACSEANASLNRFCGPAVASYVIL